MTFSPKSLDIVAIAESNEILFIDRSKPNSPKILPAVGGKTVAMSADGRHIMVVGKLKTGSEATILERL